MSFDNNQLNDLKRIAPNLSIAEEGGYSFILIDRLVLPPNCSPNIVDALLCPDQKDGYHSRLFFATQIGGCPPSRNWNGNIRVLERNWYAISWQTPLNLTLSQMLLTHLKALKL